MKTNDLPKPKKVSEDRTVSSGYSRWLDRLTQRTSKEKEG